MIFTSRTKKLFGGSLLSVFMLLGVYIGLRLVKQQQIFKKFAAVSNGAIYSFSTSGNRILIPGKETAQVNILINTNGQQVTAADLDVDATSNLLDITALTSGGFFTRTANSYGNLDTIILTVTPATGRIAVGAPCDRCYLGPSPTPGGPAIVPCTAGSTPQCYPKAANTSGTIATVTVSAKAGQSGRATLALASTTATAAVGSDVDATSTSLPSGFGICVAYDFDKNGITNTADILRVSTTYNATTGQSNFNTLYDANNDGRINTADILPVSTRYNNTCTP